jgi:hypothetical protein
MNNNKLSEAVTLIRSGDRETAKKLLMQLLHENPYNEEAWMWLAALVNGQHRIFCLQRVLGINPHNEKARAYLANHNPQTASMRYPSRFVQSDQPAIREQQNASADLQEKSMTMDGIMVFKPSKERIFWHILPGILLFLLAAFQVLMLMDLVQLAAIIIVIGIILFYAVVSFANGTNPVYDVHLTNTALVGPAIYVYPVFRRRIEFNDIDLDRTDTSLGFLGYFVIQSTGGDMIQLKGFDKQTMNELVAIIRTRKNECPSSNTLC